MSLGASYSSIPALSDSRAPAPAPPFRPRVIGAPPGTFRDLYHAFLRTPWWGALLGIVCAYLALNVCFAGGYVLIGGIANSRHGSLVDAFYFSVQTMGTIGYGAMYPVSPGANMLVVLESVTGLLVTALATGLVFAKFSLTTSRIVFTHEAVIAPMDGVPTLMLRVGNERGNQIMEAQIRMAIVRTERTKEGLKFYRMYDLVLVRERSLALSRSWTVMHSINESSPLFGHTPASLKTDEIELNVTLVGVDDTSLQAVHARTTYTDDRIVWGARHADILSEEPDGSLIVDLRKFHEVVPTDPTPDFPFPAS